ncbi:MAG: leucine-rich repeat domain-containing protein, partial [Paludibacteraceae bacterium]|nr:leucine-rich repeat domain-containing protein [Paludibacteraceae bacterium]
MNNRFTKHFVLLIAVLLASVQSGLAATSYDYEEEIDGVTAYFTFNTNDRTLTLVELSDKNIESFNVPAKASNGLKITRVYFVTYSSLYSSLKSISIPNSVTALRLDYCTSLKSIKIPNSVTALRLSHCTSLTSVEIPNSVTGIGEKAFEYCTSLTSVEIPESVTEIGEKAFSGCTSLTSIVIPESVT